ncbi:MAG: hypothetical protein Ct9H300mP18_00320 [Candidatus Neomarinimicrobiota bacterium]|nr:MAG: hypothetical protein Ct9H300mP18_00320 [Candidatus Neomarinimicrobiota bacterium]
MQKKKFIITLSTQKEALQIINNANAYVDQFKDSKREKLISLLVLDKYFSLSGQNHE